MGNKKILTRNRLSDQTSPYLLQHANNPVDWYPWCEEAFETAEREDKPVFLSIGYSTCHWCHVMAHESFEDPEVASLLNEHFISIKVDREERPDLDSVYMSVCQAFTGNGGWPMTIFLTPDRNPFFAGTFFPKTARYGQIGLTELLLIIHEKWMTDRSTLLKPIDEVLSYLNGRNETGGTLDEKLILKAIGIYKKNYDCLYGGFSEPPKFPAAHNLLFLMKYYERNSDQEVLQMVEKTLQQMARGGLFDHVGGGFCRYSTDRFYLVPHFEKMLYDNALLIHAYCKAYQMTGNSMYCEVAERTAAYILREMTAPEGGFYCAQDADSEGCEGLFYLFEPEEVIALLGVEAGEKWNSRYDITKEGNFEGKSIPNLLRGSLDIAEMEEQRQIIYEYRKQRVPLHRDDKILTSWNALMVAALCQLYRVTGKGKWLQAAEKAWHFVMEELYDGSALYVSTRNGKWSGKGFLDDYAYGIYALLALYGATYKEEYREMAEQFCEKAVQDFHDSEKQGFFLYGRENEELIFRPKETYDGALSSGNSAMAYNLVQLAFLTGEKRYEEWAESQLAFMSGVAEGYPAGYAMFLIALSDYFHGPEKITVAVRERKEIQSLPLRVPLDALVRVVQGDTKEYPLKNDQTTYYVCRGHVCLPPENELPSHYK